MSPIRQTPHRLRNLPHAQSSLCGPRLVSAYHGGERVGMKGASADDHLPARTSSVLVGVGTADYAFSSARILSIFS